MCNSIVKNKIAMSGSFYDKNSEYFMGVDSYDKYRTAACVMRKISNGSIEIAYFGIGYKLDMESEIKDIAEYFNIPASRILKEQH